MNIQNKKILIILLLALAGGGAFYLHNKDKVEDSIANLKNDGIVRETDFTPAYINVNYDGTKTDIEGISVLRRDERASDGNFTCNVYKIDTKLILATYTVPGGLTAPGIDRSPKLTYKSEELSKDRIDKIVENYCDDTPRHFTAPHPDR